MNKLLIALMVAAFAGSMADAGEVRSRATLRAFMKANPCPGGPDKGSTRRCRGYVLDHIRPLDCGGKDVPANIQWQLYADSKAKDLCERNGFMCKHRTHGPMIKECRGIYK